LLDDILQACPHGEQQTAFFRGALISWLPIELQAHLTGIDTASMKELAQQADQLWTTHRQLSPLAAVSAVEDQQLDMSSACGLCFLYHKYGADACKGDNPEACMW
jgi:hypothetical protein